MYYGSGRGGSRHFRIYVGQNFLVLKWGGGTAIEHMKQKEQYHSFSACVDGGYDIKESITDIPRDIQQTMQ